MNKHQKIVLSITPLVVIIVVLGLYGLSVRTNKKTASIANETEHSIQDNWQFIDANSFTLSLPPSWKFNTLQGIDSYIGEFVGDGIKLDFDYGWYSSPLADENDADHIVTYEMIDGYNAKLVVPKVTGKGITGVYFENLGGDSPNRLQISGENLTSSQQDVVLKIFHTLQFAEKDAHQSSSFDFTFKYGVGAKNELNTFRDTYTKDMIVGEPITIPLKLTDEELDGIHKKIEELGLDVVVTKENSSTKVIMTPCMDYDLLVQNFAVQNHIVWDGCEEGINQNLESFATYIRSIVESKEAYKALPEPQGGYM